MDVDYLPETKIRVRFRSWVKFTTLSFARHIYIGTIVIAISAECL